MSYRSEIEWTDATWNPVVGCTKISLGCQNCYAERFAERFRGVPGHPFEQGFDLRLVPRKLEEPLHWKSPKKVFVCSMSDLFHEDIPTSYIGSVFNIMSRAEWHTFQVLTKRSARLAEFGSSITWPHNVWVGVTIEHPDYIGRLYDLQCISASVKFVSLEPLLAPLPQIPLNGIDWVVAGGESGPNARPMDLNWVRDVRRQCMDFGTAFFFKQIGGRNEKGGKEKAILDGQYWHQFPQPAIASV